MGRDAHTRPRRPFSQLNATVWIERLGRNTEQQSNVSNFAADRRHKDGDRDGSPVGNFHAPLQQLVLHDVASRRVEREEEGRYSEQSASTENEGEDVHRINVLAQRTPPARGSVIDK